MVMNLLRAGCLALVDYIGFHVLTCLIPAFLLAGAIVSFVSRGAIVAYLGHAARKIQSFSLACAASFFVAACSCTVIPVAGGLYYGGSGIGPAFIVLWVAPAANILALAYTGTVIGADMALARVLTAVAMAMVVGLVMSAAFRKEEETRAAATVQGARGRIIAPTDVLLILLIAAALLAPNYLVRGGPYLRKIVVWAVGMVVAAAWALKTKPLADIRRWLAETWWFVRIIFPLLLAGVFVVGVVGELLPEALVQGWLGGCGVRASFVATLNGAISYFATMTEAPFVDTLLKLGMGRGPALALLLTGPGMSLPNILAIVRVFGARKALVYAATIVCLGTFVGWFMGTFVF